jgi:hypothetical protein
VVDHETQDPEYNKEWEADSGLVSGVHRAPTGKMRSRRASENRGGVRGRPRGGTTRGVVFRKISVVVGTVGRIWT